MDGGAVGELLGGAPLNIGAGALVTLIVILVLRGHLVPRSVLRDALDQRDKAMALADKYQKVATEQGMTLHNVLDAVETTNHVVTAIQAGLERTHKGPGR